MKEENLQINIELINDELALYMPEKATDGSVGYDCRARKIQYNNDGSVYCLLGFKTEIPKGYFADVRPRSGITKYGWVLQNSPGTIDSDFREEWQARFRPIPVSGFVSEFYTQIFPYKEGERVCQIIFQKETPTDFYRVDKVGTTDRKGGFGHTGVK